MTAVLVPISFISPLGAALLALLVFDERKGSWQHALLLGLCFAIAFHGLQLVYGNDANRHMALLANYSGIGLLDCFGAGHYAWLPVWDIWCWLVARTGDPYLLQSSVAAVGYSIIAYIAFDYGSRSGSSKPAIALVLVMAVFAIPFMSIVSGMRSALAMLVCALAFYRRTFVGGSLGVYIALLFAAAAIHPVALMGATLALVSPMLASSPRLGVSIVFVVAALSAVLGTIALPAVAGGGSSIAGYLSNAIGAFLGYSEGNAWTAMQASSLNTRVNTAFTLVWAGILCVNGLIACRRSSDEGRAAFLTCATLVWAAGAATLALSMVLEVNGTRLTPMLFALGSVCLLERMKRAPSKESTPLFELDMGTFLASACMLVLHAHSIAYGLADGGRLLMSCLMGVLGGG